MRLRWPTTLACCLAASALAQAPASPDPAAEPDPTSARTDLPLPSPARPIDRARLERELERIKRLPPIEAAREAERLQRLISGQVPSMAKQQAPTPADAMRDIERLQKGVPTGLVPATEPEWVKEEARLFFAHMLAGDARALVEHSTFPFQLEDRRLSAPEELMQEWLKALRSKRTDLVTLYGLEVLTPAEMEKKYGKPPARLAALPWRGPKTYVVIANLSGRGAIALFKEVGGGAWKAAGYHD